MAKGDYRATAEDFANEDAAQALIEQAWNCQLHHLPALFHVDWYAERGDKLVAWVEFKQRKLPSTQMLYVILNVNKKYKHLMALSQVAPAFFVVKWADGVIKYIDIKKVDATTTHMMGEYNRWGDGRHDLEECIRVPIADMTLLQGVKLT